MNGYSEQPRKRKKIALLPMRRVLNPNLLRRGSGSDSGSKGTGLVHSAQFIDHGLWHWTVRWIANSSFELVSTGTFEFPRNSPTCCISLYYDIQYNCLLACCTKDYAGGPGNTVRKSLVLSFFFLFPLRPVLFIQIPIRIMNDTSFSTSRLPIFSV